MTTTSSNGHADRTTIARGRAMTSRIGIGRITTISVCALIIGSCVSSERPDVSMPPISVARKQTLPESCTKYHREYTVADWNPVTESYPLNHEWMNCMGVGLK